MTRSYGGGGGPDKQKKKQPDLKADDGQSTFSQRKLDSPSVVPHEDETATQQPSVEFGKRLVAGGIDLLAGYLVGMVVMLIPFVNAVLCVQLVMVALMIVRDRFYAGRGIGKNLMGLQVIDIRSGQPCSLVQSIKRNIIMFGPPLVLYIVIMVLQIMRMFKVPGVSTVADIGLSVMNTLGFVYVVIVIPYEAYRAYSRSDGRRFGDQFAGTVIAEAPMDFSSPMASR